jgi:hypothetical protein
MVAKFITAVLFVLAIFIAIFSHNSNDPLYLFISGNILINIARLIIIGTLLAICLHGYIHNSKVRQALMGFGFIMLGFGLLSMANMSIESALYNYLKPLDYILISELGVTATLMSLALPKHASARYEEMPVLAKSFLFFSRQRFS